MTATLTAFEIKENAEPIPGYVLKERLGLGGYGEVWKASAPGGLTKAIKFVYGQLEEKRAARELKSLNRVKALSHPFLLTIERIEVVAGQLMMITEIADSSLRDRFDQCVEKGMQGIPRDELLNYLRETADALDFLSESQSLQHLDVKPANLLLVGNHVKVADFGLLKDLRDVSTSLINGLTPKYAAPELFDGRPSQRSDQYSLAIVYQEMLTGRLPFDGRTAAQLASQHVHSAPDLSALTPLERFAIGKALSKDHNRRFANCREFVDRLMHRSTATMILDTKKGQSDKGRTAKHRRGTKKSLNANEPQFGQKHDGHTIIVAEPETTCLPALELDCQRITYRPTIFIGLGGLAGRVMSRLKQLFADRFGDLSDVPTLQFLYVDTDMASISREVSIDSGGALREDETLVLPLRQTRDYRTEDLRDVRSISRRWIYNIPRSLHTEGLRALGRLAFLDRSNRVLEKLRSAILTATDDASLAAAIQSTKLAFCENDPRVFVIASIGGGTGSGTVVDIGYAVRQTLAELGLSDEMVTGILAYATGRGVKGRGLAPANAYACLDELQYFSVPGNDYPGEPTCGLAGFREGAATFKNTYLVDLGDDLTDDQYDDATQQLAHYAFLSSVSPASLFFDTCRKMEQENNDDSTQFQLRTFGLSQFGDETNDIPTESIEELCKCVVRKWRGGIGAATNDDRIKCSDLTRIFQDSDSTDGIDKHIEKLAFQRVSELELHHERVATVINAMIKDELGSDADEYLRRIVSESLDKALVDQDQNSSPAAKTVQTIHMIVGVEDELETNDASPIESLREVVDPKLRILGVRIGEALKDWILDFVDTSNARLDGARQACSWLSSYLESIQESAMERLRSSKTELEHFRHTLAGLDNPKQGLKSKREELSEDLCHYARLIRNRFVWESVCKTIRTIEPFTTLASDMLRDLWKDLNQLTEEFHDIADSTNWKRKTDTDPLDHADPVPSIDVFDGRKLELIEQLDREMQASFFTRERRLLHVLAKGVDVRIDLTSTMRKLARKIILRHNKNASFENVEYMLTSGAHSDVTTPIRQCLEFATPELLEIGGAKRMLCITPPQLDTSLLKHEIQRLSGGEPTVIVDPDEGFVVSYEIEQLPFDRVTATFIKRRPDCQELASRLHTRIDIDWPSI